MQKEIDLEMIYNDQTFDMRSPFDGYTYKWQAIAAMKTAVELALEMAAAEAKTKEVKVRNKYWTEHIVDKHSILAIKSRIK